MGSGSRDLVGLDVDHLDGAGRRIAGRGEHAGTTAARLHSGLETAHGHVGHPDVAHAMAAFVTDHIAADAHHLGNDVTAGGHGVSHVATTGRSSDNEGARDLHGHVAGTEDGAAALRKSID